MAEIDRIPMIDVWVNMFTPEVCHRVYVETPELKGVVDWWGLDSAKGFEVPDFVQRLDDANVSKIVIPSMKMWAHQRRALCYSVEVEEIVAAAEQAPGRIYGAAGINPWEGMKGVRKLEQAITEYGFVAGHIHAYGFDTPLNHRDWYPFYAKCAELGVPVIVQVGHSAEFMPIAVGQPVLIDDVALYFPELTIICSHTGWPWVEEMMALAWKHPNVHIATTTHAPKYWDPKFVKFANSRGQDKVMFASGWPTMDHIRARAEIEALGLKETVLPKLLHDNAAKALPRLEAEPVGDVVATAGR